VSPIRDRASLRDDDIMAAQGEVHTGLAARRPFVSFGQPILFRSLPRARRP
jgi:hypothetical protein